MESHGLDAQTLVGCKRSLAFEDYPLHDVSLPSVVTLWRFEESSWAENSGGILS